VTYKRRRPDNQTRKITVRDTREIWTVGVAQHMFVPPQITLKSGESIRRGRRQRIRLRINKSIYISLHLFSLVNESKQTAPDNTEIQPE
jgi:hypothetical protein